MKYQIKCYFSYGIRKLNKSMLISQWYTNWNKSLISSEKMPVKIIYTTELHEYEIKCWNFYTINTWIREVSWLPVLWITQMWIRIKKLCEIC